jgi:hypothetical protein
VICFEYEQVLQATWKKKLFYLHSK